MQREYSLYKQLDRVSKVNRKTQICSSRTILTNLRRGILVFNFLDLKKEAIVSDLDDYANILSNELHVSIPPVLNNSDNSLTDKSLS